MRYIMIILAFVGTLFSAKAQILPIGKQRLQQLKTAYQKNDPKACKVIGDMEQAAEKMMKAKAPIVKSKVLPPSHDARDYVSLSRYWWPDTTKADGLPYVRHDGKVNPQINDYTCAKSMGKMADAVDCLSMLYYVTGKKEYAQHCGRYLRAWFTDSITGMNPHLTYSQIIPGRSNLRGTGILDGRHFCRALCMSSLLDGYEGWTKQDKEKLRKWAEVFLYWLENSTQGQMEHRAKNNHGIWYDVTHMEVLAFLNDTNRLKEVLHNDLLAKLDQQIADDGSLPQELARTLSLHYSTFVCEAMMQASFMAQGIGENIWTQKTASHKSMQDVIAYLYPYFKNPAKWLHKQIKPFDIQRASPILMETGTALGNAEYIKLAKQIGITSKSMLLAPYYDLQK